MGDVPQELERSRERWLEVVNATDLGGYVSLLAQDGVWLPPGGGAPIVGRAAFERWLRPFFERYEYEFEVSAHVYALDGWAAEGGRFTSRMTPMQGGASMEHSGTYTLLWRRDDDGAWRIDRYIDDTAIRGA